MKMLLALSPSPWAGAHAAVGSWRARMSAACPVPWLWCPLWHSPVLGCWWWGLFGNWEAE